MANNQSLKLSAPELKRLTGLPDAFIYEFLSLESSVSEITQNINIVIEQVTQTLVTEAHTTIVLNNLQNVQESTQQLLASLEGVTDGLAANAAAMKREIASLAQSLELANSANAMLRTTIRTQAQVIASQEQATQQTGALSARLTKLESKVSDIEQAEA